MSLYVHYGTPFDMSKWEPINNHHTKPSGGFWLSPENANRGWEYFCIAEDNPELLRGEKYFFSLRDDARVLHIHSVSQIKYLPLVDGWEGIRGWKYFLDFESLAKIYDAIEVHFDNLDWCGTSPEDTVLGDALDMWDCDSIVVMNPSVLIPH